jgi:cysteine desulfuration protein SufE
MPKIDEIIDTFQSLDAELRPDVLLDYANKLPELPPDLAEAADRDDARVPECQTPVWLWIVPESGRVRIHARVAEEAPTVKGLLSILVHGYSGATREEVAHVPNDLVQRLGLSGLVRMNRMVGLTAMIQRVRRQASELPAGEPSS